MPTVVEHFDEFIARHGGDRLPIGGRYCFADGASCDDHGLIRNEPPTDPMALAEAKRLYVLEKLKRAEHEFNQAKSDFTEQAALARRYANLPGPPPNAAEILQSLKREVHELRRQLAALDEQLQDTAQAKRQRERAAAEAIRQQRIAGVYSAVLQVNLDD